MTEKEVAEIRRRFRADKNSISHVRGCFVNEKGEIVSEFNQLLGTMSDDERDSMLSILKKTLSGGLSKNLIDIEFRNEQVISGEEHKLLMTIKNSSLKDDNAINEMYQKIIASVSFETSYLILFAFDKYDVFSYSTDGEKADDSSTIFSYFLCSVCPLKLTKPALSYYAYENAFHNIDANSIIAPPEYGFMFPSFDDRMGNIYNALYYTKNISENNNEFVENIFKSELPMPAMVQKETFSSILSDTVADECNLEVVAKVHSSISDMIEEHKVNNEQEPLKISKRTLTGVLNTCGVDEEKIKEFEKSYDEQFGSETEISPKNIVDTKQFNLKTPDVTIKVNPDRSDLISTEIIDGQKYIMIRADDTVEVNGVNINI